MYVFHFSWLQTNVSQLPSTTTVRMMPRWDPSRRPLIQGLKTLIRSDFAGTIRNRWGSPMVGWRQRIVATAIATSCCNLILVWGRFNLERCFHQTGCSFWTLPTTLQVKLASLHPTLLMSPDLRHWGIKFYTTRCALVTFLLGAEKQT